MILNKFRNQTMIPLLDKIAKSLNDKDYMRFNNGAHSLKGASGYVGAGAVHYDCYFIQEAFLKKNHDDMDIRYCRLIENIVEFTNYIHSKKFKDDNPEDKEHIEKIGGRPLGASSLKLPQNYKIEKVSGYEVEYLCLKDGQSVEDR